MSNNNNAPSARNKSHKKTTPSAPAGAEQVAEAVTVATTEPEVGEMTTQQAAKQFEALITTAAVPAERKTGTADNARWFLRKGWIFCITCPNMDELRRLAQIIA